MVLHPALGNYASGDRFWDRDGDVAEIVGYLNTGLSVLLDGPRRIGKTSVVHRVLEQLGTSVTPLFVDVQHHADPAELFAAIAAAASANDGFWARMRALFGKRLGVAMDRVDSIELSILKVELQGAMAGSWRDDAREILEALRQQQPPVVVAIDELPLLVDRLLKRDRAQADLLMGVLRESADRSDGIRWLVSGSIGLEAVLHRAGLAGTITYLRKHTIAAWDKTTTAGAVHALAESAGLVLAPGVGQRVHALLGLGVPYHVQLFVDELRRDATRSGDPHVSEADVDRVYEGPFLTSSVRAHLLHLESRLTSVLGEGDALRLARDLLTQAAVAGVLTREQAMLLADDLVEDDRERTAVLHEALAILEHDVYLEPQDDGWRFCSRLVRDWWRQRNELGFTRPEERKRRS